MECGECSLSTEDKDGTLQEEEKETRNVKRAKQIQPVVEEKLLDQAVICSSNAQVLVLEPYCGGSHKQLVEQLQILKSEGITMDVFSLPAKKWKWRLRTAAVWMATTVIPKEHQYKVLFCSSMLNLAELIAVRKDLQTLKKILYFHENQLNYPSRNEKERDWQLGWIQIVSCLAADQILFNSQYNMNSFLQAIPKCLKIIPNYGPNDMSEAIRPKASVLYFPVQFPQVAVRTSKSGPLHILWNHRWEYDKRPDLFFDSLYQLQDAKLQFTVSVIGQQFDRVPDVFEEARQKLSTHIKRWGYVESKEEYFNILKSEIDIVVSTTDHEFLGVSVIEATSQGCYPLCPNRLVFPEYLSRDFLYDTHAQLVKKLRYYARYPEKLRRLDWHVELAQFHWDSVKSSYKTLFC